MKKLDFTTKLLLTILTISLVFLGVVLANKYVKENNKSEVSVDFLMDTFVEQRATGKNSKKAVDKVIEELKKFEQNYSLHIDNSLVDRINKNAGIAPVQLTNEEFEFLKTSVEYSKLSGGVFDVSVSPVIALWGFQTDAPKVPSEKDLAEKLDLVSYENIELNEENKTIYLTKKGMAIDLGGIAKGKSLDIVKEIYDEFQIKEGFVSVGGNIYVYGKAGHNNPSKIGIKNPDSQENEMVGNVLMENQIIATSGAYERFFEENNEKYHHIIDPRTGKPANSDLKSVSIIADDGALSDYLSTTFFVLGENAVREQLSNEQFGIIAITQNNEILVSNHLENKFEKYDEGENEKK